jgi:hypothetical protein
MPKTARDVPYVPQYEYDIFVSYAHVDDDPLPGANEGWVSTLVRSLKTRLAQKLGRSDAYSLWMDHELSGSEPVTSQIAGELRALGCCGRVRPAQQGSGPPAKGVTKIRQHRLVRRCPQC